jgi:integration host factor subunit beta
MNRSELIKYIANAFPQLTFKDVEMSVGIILEAISTKLGEGERVEIRGFGSFGINVRPPRIGRNPKSGSKVYVTAKAAPHFKPGLELRLRVNSL